MKIKFINPLSMKFGKEEHVKNLVGECLIAAGEAEEVKYGSFVEMMNDAPGRKPPVDPNIFEWVSVHTSIWRTADISKAGCFRQHDVLQNAAQRLPACSG